MNEAAIDFDGLTVAVLADSGDIAWLLEFYGLRAEQRHGTDRRAVTVQLLHDADRLAEARAGSTTAARAPGFLFENKVALMPSWQVGDARHVFDTELDVLVELRHRSISIVGGDDDGAARLALLRVVRELHQRHLASRGFSLFHAAAVAIEERCVLIAGDRRSGKTTVLTYLLAHGGATYVSNDRTAVDGTDMTIGVPTMVSIRPGTFGLVPDLGPIPWRRGRPRRTIAELETGVDEDGGRRSSSTALSPEQYCVWLGAPRVRKGRAVALIFPEIDHAPAPVVEPLGVGEAKARIESVTMRPDPRGVFEDVVAAGDAPLTRSLPAYRCRVGEYPRDAARTLLDAVLEDAERRAASS